MSQVIVQDVTKTYGTVRAVDSLSLTVSEGEFVSLLGPSGCGKTTLLRLIAGLIQPESGTIQIGGNPVTDIPPYDRNLAMVFQNYSLFPHMTVEQNVGFGLKMRGVPKEEARERIGRALELVRLPGFEARYPRQMSGGQQQRVALARSIVYEPDVLLLDEPFGALDRKLRAEMQIELKTLQRQLGITTIFVTHDQEEALTISHRIAVMLEGHIEQLDTPQGIYERPASPFVSDFIGITNLISGEVVARDGSPVLLTNRGLAIPLIPSDVAPGPVTISVRPERIDLLEPGAAKGTGVTGRIREKVYLGAATHYYIEFESGDQLIAIHQGRQNGGLGLDYGDPVALSWAPEDVVVLSD
jgi:spermidine/putrescine ABC transporter ATP-binding subunit